MSDRVHMAPLRSFFVLRPRRQFIAASLAIAAVVVVVGLPQVLREDPLSPLDEITHIDYAWQLSQGEVPYRGAPIDDEMLQDWSCFDQINVELPKCGDAENSVHYPGRGENYNFSHPPTYYAVSGVIARFIDGLTPTTNDFVTSLRSVGLMWSFAGAVVLMLALRRFALPWAIALPTASLAVVWNPLLSGSVTASNDAPALLAGALALLVLAHLSRGRLDWVLPIVATGLLTSTKILHGVVFIAVALFLILRATVPSLNVPPISRTRLWMVAIGMIAAVGTVFVGWSAFQSHRGVQDWVSPISGVSNRPIEGLPFDEWSTTFFIGLTNYGIGYTNPSTDSWIVLSVFLLLSALMIAAPFVVVSMQDGRSFGFAVAISALIGLTIYPSIVQFQVFLNSGGVDYFPALTARYGISLHPLVLACIGFAMHNLGWYRPYVIFAGAVVGLSIVAVF